MLTALAACALATAFVGFSAAMDVPAFQRRDFALPQRCDAVVVADADADGVRDLVAICQTRVIALRMPGGVALTLHESSGGAFIHGAAWDADGDGDADVALARFNRPAADAADSGWSLAWLENPGVAGAAWPLRVLDRELDGVHGVAVGDLDGDGRGDLVAVSVKGPAFPNGLAAFIAGATPARVVIAERGAGSKVHYVDVADLDGDGRRDVVLGGGADATWWRNPGSAGGAWARSPIAARSGLTNVKAADLDGDGRIDVVASCGHGRGVHRWLRRGEGWEHAVVDDGIGDAHALDVGDLDGDGDVDVAVCAYGAKVARWYANDGRGGFTTHPLGEGHEAYDLRIADVDGDGRADMVVAGRASRLLVLYRNLGAR